MKVFTGRLLAAFLLISPFWTSAAARADSEKTSGQHASESQESGDHHSEGNGNNDDSESGGDQSDGSHGDHGTGGGQLGSSGESGDSADEWLKSKARRRVAAFVAAPVLDTQQTRDAIDSGRAASLPLLTTYLNNYYPGQVLDVKLHDAPDGYVYEVRYLSNIVVLRTLFLDAATLKAK
jgi:hypothetical protein